MLSRTSHHPQGLFLSRSYICYRALGSVAIDGNFDKKFWWEASYIEIFKD